MILPRAPTVVTEKMSLIGHSVKKIRKEESKIDFPGLKNNINQPPLIE